MMKSPQIIRQSTNLFIFLIFTSCFYANAQDSDSEDLAYNQYEALVKEVKLQRAERILSLDEFIEMSKNECAIILDMRSKEMYDLKHLKGAVHLDFSDFTQKNLDQLFESKDVKILIYCNNNIDENRLKNSFMRTEYFPTKCATPKIKQPVFQEYFPLQKSDQASNFQSEKIELNDLENESSDKHLYLPMTIPSYISLYGYGYRNVYELGEVVSLEDERISFEGSAVKVD